MEGTIGEIRLFGGNFAPRGWNFCNGALLSIAVYTAAYSIVGTTYGGDGQTTFAVPDLRGRVPVGTGTGGGVTSVQLGEMAGTENLSVLVSNLPTHTHTATFSGTGGTPGTYNSSLKVSALPATANIAGTGSPAATSLGAPNYNDGSGGSALSILGYVNDDNPTIPLVGLSVTQGSSGGGGTVTNALTGNSVPLPAMQPYLALNYIMCIEGIFPSRN
jgi:microcystin-dependent protein